MTAGTTTCGSSEPICASAISATNRRPVKRMHPILPRSLATHFCLPEYANADGSAEFSFRRPARHDSDDAAAYFPYEKIAGKPRPTPPPIRANSNKWTSMDTMYLVKTFALFVVTAVAEIVGCYLPYLWLKKDGSAWLLLPAAMSLAVFVWLLTLHPHAAGRIYAAYGGIYVGVAIFWLWLIDAVRPTAWDLAGVAITLVGMAVIMLGPARTS